MKSLLNYRLFLIRENPLFPCHPRSMLLSCFSSLGLAIQPMSSIPPPASIQFERHVNRVQAFFVFIRLAVKKHRVILLDPFIDFVHAANGWRQGFALDNGQVQFIVHVSFLNYPGVFDKDPAMYTFGIGPLRASPADRCYWRPGVERYPENP